MRGSAARSIVGGIVGEECPRCRGSVPAEAAFAVRRHESKSNVITFESEHPSCISSLRRFFGLPVVPRALLQILNVHVFHRTISSSVNCELFPGIKIGRIFRHLVIFKSEFVTIWSILSLY